MPEESRSVGYICPVCGNAVIAQRTAFQLAAGNSALPCPCGRSELRFTQLGDRCEIAVPCLFCARDHTAVCSNDALLRQKLLALSCPASGLGLAIVRALAERMVHTAAARWEDGRFTVEVRWRV